MLSIFSIVIDCSSPQLYTDEIPLSTVPYSAFIELVFKFGVRPQRPDEDEFPRLSDGIWDLAEQCWDKDPKARLSATQIYDTIQLHMVDLPKTIPMK